MAINLGFSFLANGRIFFLDPFVSGDKLIFDKTEISAADVKVFDSTDPNIGSFVVLSTTLDNKLAGFVVNDDLTLVMKNLSSTFVQFADGSFLKVGDNTLSTAKDDLANKLVGGVMNDHLIGLGGNDTLTGGGGNDFLEGSAGNDRLDGSAGNDIFLDSQGANRFIGGAGNDFFFVQGPGNATLDGGANTATGGADRDTYYVSNSKFLFPTINYTVTDFDASGADHDLINVSSVLAQIANASGFYHGENPLGVFVRVVQSGPDALVQADFSGADTITGFETVLKLASTSAGNADDCITGYVLGNGNPNTLTGDATNQFLYAAGGNDVLDGRGGADNMYGGAGNDTYHVDNGSDVAREISNTGGTDTVIATVNFSLAPDSMEFVENLRLTGSVARDATGNDLGNSITGNALANKLTGLGGNDALSGGAGNDTLIGGEGNDRMTWGKGDVLIGQGGTDTVKLGGGVNLDLTTIADADIQAEKLDMTGGENTLKLSKSDVLHLSSETDKISVLGDASDTVDIVGSFTVGVVVGDFRSYGLGGGAKLLIDTDIDVT